MNPDDMPKFTNGATAPPAPPKRRGRPPKAEKDAAASKPRKKYKKRKARKAVAPAVEEREYACFLDEEGGIQLCRTDGEGDALQLSRADAFAIAAFVEKYRAAMESA